MSIFAKIENGKVVDVIVADKSFIDNLSETFIESEDSSGVVLRKNQATKGMNYSTPLDAFYWDETYKEAPSFVWDASLCKWVAPVSYPNDGKKYWWNEETRSWKEEPSFVWDASLNQWVAPASYPTDGKEYWWHEETRSWKEEPYPTDGKEYEWNEDITSWVEVEVT